jgi:hypothetical protein
MIAIGIKPFEGWGLNIKKGEVVVLKGRYPNAKMACDIAEKFFSRWFPALGFKFDKKEKESLKRIGLAHSFQGPRMGGHVVSIFRDYEQKLSQAYFHINNGGVHFDVIDNGDNGARVDVWAEHFGNHTAGIKLFTDAESLRKLGEMFVAASKHKFTERYCFATKCKSC